MPEYVTSAAVKQSRELMLQRARDAKKQIVSFLDSGDRKFAELRVLVDVYADAQNAADVLSGQTQVTS